MRARQVFRYRTVQHGGEQVDGGPDDGCGGEQDLVDVRVEPLPVQAGGVDQA